MYRLDYKHLTCLVSRKNMFYVYVLLSEDRKSFYKGITCNLERRLSEHRLGKSNTTKQFGKFSLIVKEVYNTRQDARNREKYLKSGVGREYLRSILENNNEM